MPRLVYHDTIVAAVPRKIYANAHAYHINSLSVNSDGETYISADDLRINLWNLGISDQSFNIVDIKPVNMEELTEGGRVVMFERANSSNGGSKQGCEYRFHTEFQSHEPEFDYLKSLEIEEKINQICWCKRQNAAHMLLSTNGTCISR